jgi:molybdenum cofactor cytidylyltransferase
MSAGTVGVIVLAAGASERMGEPKQLLRFGGETLLRRAVRAALDSRCRPAVVVLGARAEELRGEVDGAQAVVNAGWAEGMASSIRCGLLALEASAPAPADGAVLTLCDQPFVTSEVINRLLEAYRAGRPPLVASEYVAGGESARGAPALFSRALFPELIALRGGEGARQVIRRHAPAAAFVPVPEAAFDVDTPGDYLGLTRRAANGPAAAD